MTFLKFLKTADKQQVPSRNLDDILDINAPWPQPWHSSCGKAGEKNLPH